MHIIVCFTSSSEHTISNRLKAGPLTQTGFPDGGRLFHSTGKQQGGGVVGIFFSFFFFFADRVGNCSYTPHPAEDGVGSRSHSQLVCVCLSASHTQLCPFQRILCRINKQFAVSLRTPHKSNRQQWTYCWWRDGALVYRHIHTNASQTLWMTINVSCLFPSAVTSPPPKSVTLTVLMPLQELQRCCSEFIFMYKKKRGWWGRVGASDKTFTVARL